MTTVATLKALVTLDATGLVNGLELTKKEIREAAREADAGQSGFQSFGNRIELLQRAQLAGHLTHEQYARAASTARLEMLQGIPVLGRFAGMFDPITASMTLATTGIAAFTAGVALVTAGVAERIHTIDELGDSADKLGMSLTGLSRLTIAADLGDVKQDALIGFLEHMQASLGNAALGSDGARESFSKLGIDWEHIIDLDPARQFEAVAKAVNGLPNNSEKIAALREIGGKGGGDIKAFVDQFERLIEAANATGAIVPESLGGDVEAVTRATKELGYAWDGVMNSVTLLAADPLADILNTTKDVVSDAKLMRELLVLAGGIGFGMGGMGTGQRIGDAMIDAEKRRKGELADIDAGRATAGRDGELANTDADRAAAHREMAIASAETTRQSDAQVNLSRRQLETIEKSLKAMQLESDLLGKTNEERAFLKTLTMPGATEEHAQRAADLQNEIDMRRVEFDLERDQARWRAEAQRDAMEKEQAWLREMNQLRAQAAIKEIDEAERIKESLKTQKQLAEDRAEAIGRLHAGGLLTDEERDRALAKEASRFGSSELRWPVAADKGTRAAQEAILGAKAQQEQVTLQRQMIEHLRRIADKEATTLEVISD